MKSIDRKKYIFITVVSLLIITIIIIISIQNSLMIRGYENGEIGRTELFAKGVQRPQGLAIGKDDKLFTQCSYDGKISVINKDGKSFDYTYLDNHYGYGIEIDEDDNILMAARNEVVRLDSSGQIIQIYKDFTSAYDVEQMPDKTIFVSDSQENRIYKISPEGDIALFATLGSRMTKNMANAAGIRFDKEYKNLYAANMYTGEIYKISINEDYSIKKLEVIAAGLEKPNFLDVDAEGNLYVTCLGDNTVVRVDQNSIVELIDTYGKLSSPFGIALVSSRSNESTLYVASRDSNSIYKINIGIKNKAKK